LILNGILTNALLSRDHGAGSRFQSAVPRFIRTIAATICATIASRQEELSRERSVVVKDVEVIHV